MAAEPDWIRRKENGEVCNRTCWVETACMFALPYGPQGRREVGDLARPSPPLHDGVTGSHGRSTEAVGL